MRKTFTVVLTVMLCLLAFTACSNEKDETATVSFSIPDSLRDLGQNIDGADTTQGDIVWIYTATPAAGNAFTYGATGEDQYAVVTMNETDSSFKSVGISLSKGMWSFTLRAINTSITEANNTNGVYTIDTFTINTNINSTGEESPSIPASVTGVQVYYGEVSNVIVDGTTNIPIEISKIIPNGTAYIKFDKVSIAPKDSTAASRAPNKISINGNEYTPDSTAYKIYASEDDFKAADTENTGYGLYYNHEDATDNSLATSVSGTLKVKSGEYKVIVSYISSFDTDDDGENDKDLINASESITKAIATYQTFILSGQINEDTTSAYFNGIMTDGSLGNVYDTNTNTYYTLEIDGDNWVFKQNGVEVDAPDKGSYDDNPTTLELLDCGMSNDIPDGLINDHFETMNFSDNMQESFKNNNSYYNKDGYEWKVYHPVNCEHTTATTVNNLYAGGYGTKLEPYCINSVENMWNDTHLARSTYAYYKWTGTEEIDFEFQYTLGNLRGSFDGNGAFVTNSFRNLFGNFYADSNNTQVTIKNLIFKSDFAYSDRACSVVHGIYYLTTFKNIEVSGTQIGRAGTASFASVIYSNNVTVNFENCISTTELVYVDDSGDLAGFVTNGYRTTSAINLINSTFKGSMYKKSSNNICKYNYVVYDSAGKIIVNDYATKDDYLNRDKTLISQANADDLYNSSWIALKNLNTFIYEDISSINTTSTVVTAVDNAATADFYLDVRVKGTDLGSSAHYNYMIKDTIKEKTDNNTTFTSNYIRDYDITLDGENLSIDTTNSKINFGLKDRPSDAKITITQKYLVVIQRAAGTNGQLGQIVKVNSYYGEKTV